MPTSRLLIAVWVLLTVGTALGDTGAEGAVPRDHHPWGRFGAGSWKLVRVVTETLDPQQKILSTSTTETKTTLVDVHDSGYTLEIQVTVEVAGRRFAAQSQTVKHGFSGESDGQTVSTKALGTGRVTVEGQEIATEIREVTITGGDSKRVSTLYYSPTIEPFVLRRDTDVSDAKGETVQSRTQVEIVAMEMPYQVLEEMVATSHIKTVQRRDKSSTVTVEVHCLEVPGGVVAHWSKELDETCVIARRSTLELLDFRVIEPDTPQTEPARRRLFFNRHRFRKASR